MTLGVATLAFGGPFNESFKGYRAIKDFTGTVLGYPS